MGGRARAAARRKRGDGSRCPRSSSACATFAFRQERARARAESGLHAAALLGLSVRATLLWSTGLQLAGGCPSNLIVRAIADANCRMFLYGLRCHWPYGGEAFEVIQFMERESTVQSDEEWLEEFHKSKREVEALPFVKGEIALVYSDVRANNNKVKATVWCCWECNRRSFKQECVACDEKDRPTHLEALRALKTKLIEKHGANKHVPDDRAVQRREALQLPASTEQLRATSTEPPVFDRHALLNAKNALDRLAAAQRFKSQREYAERMTREAGKREHQANMALHAARKEHREAVAHGEAMRASLAEAAELVEELQKPGKKARTTQLGSPNEECATGSSITAGCTAGPPMSDGNTSHSDSDESSHRIPDFSGWDMASKWKELESRAQAQRNVQIDAAMDHDQSKPRKGSSGWRWHWRHGLVGGVQYWASGRRLRVVHILANLATYFGVQTEVAAHLGFTLSKEEVAQLKVDTYLIDRVVQALSQLKRCRSQSEREDYHTVLAALAPERGVERSREGMLRAVSQRLGVERGARYSKGEKRPYALDQAVTRREAFDEAMVKCGDALKAGDEGIARGQPCTIVEIDHEKDTCKLRFSQRGAETTRDYTCIYKGRSAGKRAPFPKGSARLQRPPPSLRVQPRVTRCDAKMEAARAKVEELFDAEGARSPSQRDSVRRRVGVGLFEVAQALIVYAKYSSLYALYCSRYAANHISFATFKKLRPWYVRRAKEETQAIVK